MSSANRRSIPPAIVTCVLDDTINDSVQPSTLHGFDGKDLLEMCPIEAPRGKLQGIFCLTAVLPGDRKEVRHFRVRSLTPQSRHGGTGNVLALWNPPRVVPFAEFHRARRAVQTGAHRTGMRRALGLS